MINKNVALVVFACDRYELLYKGFEYTFNKYWDFNIDCNYYFSTETIDADINNFVSVKSGNGPWSNRLKHVLQKIDEAYIILFQEDMWMNNKFNGKALNEIIQHTIKHQLKLVKLHSTQKYRTNSVGLNFGGIEFAKIDKKKSKFLMSHQVSVWDKQFLIDQLTDNEDPWMNERKGTKRLKKSDVDIYQVDLLACNNLPPNNENIKPDARGSYKTVSYDAIVAKEATIFFEELNRVDPDYSAKLAYNLENSITHDGKEKPRTKGLFKKIMRELRYQLGKFKS